MIIAIAGIKRSGSTVQFNLVRIALEMAGYKVNICGHNYTPRDVPEGEVDLVKRHKFSKEIAESADHIFLTDRKDEEIIASLTRFNGKEPYNGRVKDMRKHLNKWIEYTDTRHYFYYSEWVKDPLNYTIRLVGALGSHIRRHIKAEDVLEAFNEIEPPESGQDPVTLMFSNHITQ